MNPDFITKLKIENESLLNELSEYNDLIKKYEIVKRRLDAVQTLLILYNENPNDASISPNGSGSNYDSNAIWEEKFLFALKELGTGYASDIADKVIAYEPKLDRKRVKEAASFYLSKLLKEDRIKKIGQSGRKYKFGLN